MAALPRRKGRGQNLYCPRHLGVWRWNGSLAAPPSRSDRLHELAAAQRSTMPPVSAARSERNLRQVQTPNPIVRNVERDLVSVIHDRPGAQLCVLVPPHAVL